MDEDEIVDMINEELYHVAFEDEDLIDDETWRYICRIHGWHFNEIDPDAWIELCRHRGKAKSKKYPWCFK